MLSTIFDLDFISLRSNMCLQFNIQYKCQEIMKIHRHNISHHSVSSAMRRRRNRKTFIPAYALKHTCYFSLKKITKTRLLVPKV